ncbi:MAG: hypothetical protein NTU95_04900 [Methanothrix sp.]|nr:hypothetical protein [Methanothrix sp.]
MNRKMICILVIFAFLLSVQNVVGPASKFSGSTSSSSGSGGGSKQVDIDSLLKAVKDGKDKKPAKFNDLKNLLWKDPITNENYTLPTVLMYYKGNNTTISRTEPVEIVTVVTNNNLPEQRRMLDLYLEVKEPGSSEYRRVNSWPEKIQVNNEYSDKTNSTQRTWSMLPSFIYLKKVGEVKVRVNVSDGVNRWSTASYAGMKPPYYSELVFNVTNSLPKMSDFNVTPDGLVRYNDAIEYKANIEDIDGDLLNVTLHILDDKGVAIKNETVNIKPGPVSFKANEYGFFTEADAGKNFTYYYSYDDGINFVSKDPEEPLEGPNIKKGAKLYVDKFESSGSSENYYWWEKYGFSVRAKNLNPEEYEVSFTLSTRTNNNEWNPVETKTEKIGPEPVVVRFNKTQPFKVTDAGKTFYYRVKYTEYDQTNKDFMEKTGEKINDKIVPYSIYDGIMILNLLPMLFLVTLFGLLMERTLKKGVEAHERSSVKGGDKKKVQRKSGKNIVDSILKMLKRS